MGDWLRRVLHQQVLRHGVRTAWTNIEGTETQVICGCLKFGWKETPR